MMPRDGGILAISQTRKGEVETASKGSSRVAERSLMSGASYRDRALQNRAARRVGAGA